MESQDLLHPNADENQSQEVNSGASMEGQTVENTDANSAAETENVEPAPIEEPAAPEAVEEPAPEEPVAEPAEAVEEPAPEAPVTEPAETQSVSEMINEIENNQAPESEEEVETEEPT